MANSSKGSMAAADFTMQSAADHTITLQCPNGGWNVPGSVIDCSATYNDITAPIALGLLHANVYTGDPDQLAAAVSGGNYDLTFVFGNGEARFGVFAPYFLWKLSAASGDLAYSHHAASKFFDELMAGTYGPSDLDTAGWIAGVQAAHGGDQINLRPWDFHTLVATASAIGNTGQGAAFRRALLDGLDTLDNTDAQNVSHDLIGLAGGIRGLALSGTISFAAINSPKFAPINGVTALCDLADVLASDQNADGSWYRASTIPIPGLTDKDTQTTAYAVMALAEAEGRGCCGLAEHIANGRAWLRTMQLTNGSFATYPTAGNSNVEIDGETLNALIPSLCAGDVLEFRLPTGSNCVKTGDTVIVDLWQRALNQPIGGFQAFSLFDTSALTFASGTYTASPYGFPVITPIAASGGNIDMAADVYTLGGQLPTSNDAKLLTLSFTAGATEGPTVVSFRPHDPPSRFTDGGGAEVLPCLIESPTIVIDNTNPVIACPSNVTVECSASPLPSNTGSASTTDNLDCSPVVTFTDSVAGGSCAQSSVITRTWKAADACGNFSTCDQVITVVDTTAPVLSACPANITVPADAGGCTAIVSFPPPTAVDPCDPSPSVVCSPPSGSTFAPGTTLVTCTAHDGCLNSSPICSFSITVTAVNIVDVSVQLQPTVLAGPFTHCVSFELWDCQGSTPAASLDKVVTFQDGLASETLSIACGNYHCMTARDKRHTLQRKDGTLGIVGSHYSADFTGDPASGGNWLIGGNLNGDGFIDILDFGLFSSHYLQHFASENTTCSNSAPHADINGDGIVNLAEFSFIGVNFLKGDDANCCGAAAVAAQKDPVARISVLELAARGLGDLSVGDLNGDGWLDEADIAAFASGVRPQARLPVGDGDKGKHIRSNREFGR
ncbi:MAG: HYR domain-containing protein [Planctomycetes bacterium]|nr:HYR domain-containing protein [Planctomycetota bacterium]MBI3835270.1 HYR domain-containing protein [Planctomycetota bacterium]